MKMNPVQRLLLNPSYRESLQGRRQILGERIFDMEKRLRKMDRQYLTMVDQMPEDWSQVEALLDEMCRLDRLIASDTVEFESLLPSKSERFSKSHHPALRITTS